MPADESSFVPKNPRTDNPKFCMCGAHAADTECICAQFQLDEPVVKPKVKRTSIAKPKKTVKRKR